MRVLLIEDERKVADAIVRGLRAERHVVDVAYDGDDGWVRASNSDYDVIVLDLMLPGLSGREVLQRLRRQQSQAAVMVLTARDATDDKVALFEIGADDYLTKPFAFAELRARLLALTRRPHTTRTHLLRVADLELDRLTREVRRASRRIELTSKEYALLEYMLAHSGRVLTRNMILEQVWDESFEGLTNIVDVYVRHLREKVDLPYPVKLIRTVRGAGYCLSEEDETAA
jgi:two-component system copper resistance phosphate regulon response regulator CusR